MPAPRHTHLHMPSTQAHHHEGLSKRTSVSGTVSELAAESPWSSSSWPGAVTWLPSSEEVRWRLPLFLSCLSTALLACLHHRHRCKVTQPAGSSCSWILEEQARLQSRVAVAEMGLCPPPTDQQHRLCYLCCSGSTLRCTRRQHI